VERQPAYKFSPMMTVIKELDRESPGGETHHVLVVATNGCGEDAVLPPLEDFRDDSKLNVTVNVSCYFAEVLKPTGGTGGTGNVQMGQATFACGF
jgi:hypothetical protein